MKKLLSVLIAGALFFSSFALAEDVKVTQDNNIWSVSASFTKAVDIPTIRIYNADKTALYYIGEGSCEALEEGGYIYSFDTFTFPKSVPSGVYVAVVGGNGTDEKSLSFNYANPQDKANALNAVATASAKELTDIILDKAGILEIDNTAYKKLPSTWKDYVNENLKKNDYSNDESIADVNKKSAKFIEDYTALLNIADVLGGDTSYDWGTVEKTLFAFSETLDSPIDFSAYNKLTSSQRADVIRKLKKSSISDYNSLDNTFKKLVNDARSSGGSSGTSGGGGGGGGKQVTGTSGNSVYQTTTKQTVSDDLISWLIEPYTIKEKSQTIQILKNLLNK